MFQNKLTLLTPDELKSFIKPINEKLELLQNQLKELKQQPQEQTPVKYLTRKEVGKMLSVNLATVHNMTVKGILKKYQIGGRVLYKLDEVENAIVELQK
ncbi:hypothetical protein BWZ22_08675 [Seonamhaeicola sp. S2-3]|uniref:helix-turn-helix domain-containing protein n=1 Tax=Seonamhaeicola sp. S2-3 TaxID=1936081 RepID=UPI000972CF7A|nr:helix-turn-helix domain-containing protein [Seonamhaeicola sp. S2-3]APY11310.1 hypothetical protein BWZ22_08675 [Seonamhaeicola sp. S2-3]